MSGGSRFKERPEDQVTYAPFPDGYYRVTTRVVRIERKENCEECGLAFFTTRYEEGQTKQRYCSNQCGNVVRKRRHRAQL